MTSRRPALSLVLAPFLAVVLAACGAESSEPTSATDDAASGAGVAEPSEVAAAEQDPQEKKAPSGDLPAILDFSAATVAGDEFAGASLAGRPAVLWFWAPWCPTCRGQIEGVSDLVGEYGDEVGFVGVGSLDEASAIEDFAADVPADLPQLLDPDGAVWRHFGVVEQSTYVVLDAEGAVVSQGYLDDAELADAVSGLAG